MNDQNPAQIKAEFEKLAPWITKFHLAGADFGGDFDALNDVRIRQFFEIFPRAKSIVELGSLEGGHSFALAQNASVERVLAIEGRAANIAKAIAVAHDKDMSVVALTGRREVSHGRHKTLNS